MPAVCDILIPMKASTRPWLRWLLFFFWGACVAFAMSARFTGFIGASRLEKIYYFGFSWVLFALFPAVILYSTLENIFGQISKATLLRLLAVSALLSAAILILFTNLPHFPETHHLKIIVPGSEQTDNEIHPARIISIDRVYQPGRERIKIDPSELTLLGDWQQLADDSLQLNGSQPGTILYDAFMQAGIDVTFQTGPDQENLSVEWDGKNRELTLNPFRQVQSQNPLFLPEILPGLTPPGKFL